MMALLVIGGAWWLRDRSDGVENLRNQRIAARALARGDANTREADGVPEGWKAAGEKERQAAQKAISDQLAAFRKDDYKTAARWQSRGLRENFPTVEDFRSAITTGYPQFAHSKSVRYGSAVMTPSGAQLQIQAFVMGRDDVEVSALYVMVREEGVYRVASVLPLESQTAADPTPTPDIISI